MTATALVIDPSPAGRIHLTEVLQGTGQFAHILLAGTPQRALTFLDAGGVDIILLGWRMDSVEPGKTLLRRLHQREAWSDLPVAAFAQESSGSRLAAFEVGICQVFDYHSHLAEVTAGIRLLLQQKKKIERLRQDKEHLSRLALTDALTGLYNRAYFEASLEIEIARSLRTGDPCSLLLLDLDHFKNINDTYGHSAGDHALQMVAETLKQGVRRSDVLCRFGGEEFAAILPGTAAPAAFVLAERLRTRIGQLSAGSPLNELRLSASIGISSLCTRGEVPSRRMIEEADCALYRGKRNGRNRTEIFIGPVAAPGEEFSALDGMPIGCA